MNQNVVDHYRRHVSASEAIRQKELAADAGHNERLAAEHQERCDALHTIFFGAPTSDGGVRVGLDLGQVARGIQPGTPNDLLGPDRRQDTISDQARAFLRQRGLV
jgi:hypothetical protein